MAEPQPEPPLSREPATPIPPINPTPRRDYQPEPPRKSNTLKYVIGLLALLLLCGIGALCYLLFFKGDKPADPAKETPVKEEISGSAQSAARVLSIEETLDSVANALPEEAGLVAIYPDDRACLYYVFNGELFKYSAADDETVSQTIPVEAETDAVIFAEEEEDGQYIKVDVGDENLKHTAYYRLNTQTGTLIRVKETTKPESATAAKPEPPAQNMRRPNDMPPPTDRGDRDTRYREPRTIDGQRPDRPRRGWRDDSRQAPPRDEEVAPPNSNSSGFHLEPANRQPGSNNQSGNNGIRFQKVNRIPNQ